jgi:DnaJ-class molecular chaperone
MVEIVYEEILCPECGGEGNLDGDGCPVCSGTGALRQALFVEVEVDELPLAA